MNRTLQHRGYEGSVVFDAEDHLFHGKLIGIRDFILYDGENVAELEKSFQEAVDEYLRFCKEDGKEPEIPFSNFSTHFPAELHKRASLFAEEHDLELNAVVEKALSEFLVQAD